ncbi:hypothetical protein D3C76_815030 [compost metagenome]
MHVPFAQLFVEDRKFVGGLVDFVLPAFAAQPILRLFLHRVAGGLGCFSQCFKSIRQCLEGLVWISSAVGRAIYGWPPGCCGS